MFDVFLALLLVRALVISAWRRFPAGLVASGVGTLLLLGLDASGWYGRVGDELRMTGVWLLVFLGPSAVPGPTAAVLGSAAGTAPPVGAKLVMAALFVVPFTWAWRRAQGCPRSATRRQQGMCLVVAEVAPDWT